MDTTLAQLLNHIFELEIEKAEMLKELQNRSPYPPAGIDAPQEQPTSESE